MGVKLSSSTKIQPKQGKVAYEIHHKAPHSKCEREIQCDYSKNGSLMYEEFRSTVSNHYSSTDHWCLVRQNQNGGTSHWAHNEVGGKLLT